MSKLSRLLFLSLLISSMSYAKDISCYIDVNCGPSSRASSSNPSTGNQIRLNPAVVPTHQGLGLEGIFYSSSVDFSIVRGLGRIGAAISPSNSDETFFGTPGFEIPESLLDRKTNKTKYPNQKYSFATAMALVEKSRSVWTSYALKLGVMAKYNRLTKHGHGGGGLSGLLGPVTFGYSNYNDESVLDYSLLGSTYTEAKKYRVKTYSMGLSFYSFLIDVSNLSYLDPQYDYSTEETSVKLITASFNYKKFLFTASERVEKSHRPVYDYDTKELKYEYTKKDNFYAVQYIANKNITVGLLYNYYLLHELSLIGTVFF